MTSMVVQAGVLEQRLTDWRMAVDDIHLRLAPLGLSDRQIDGLIYALKIGYVTRKDYAEIANVSLLTATRDLTTMVQKGILEPHGVARNRKYYFKSPTNHQTGKEEAQRQLL